MSEKVIQVFDYLEATILDLRHYDRVFLEVRDAACP